MRIKNRRQINVKFIAPNKLLIPDKCKAKMIWIGVSHY